jgi:hypothetical protein
MLREDGWGSFASWDDSQFQRKRLAVADYVITRTVGEGPLAGNEGG